MGTACIKRSSLILLAALPLTITHPASILMHHFHAADGFKGSIFSSCLDEAPEYRCALSLLSSNSWGSCEPKSIILNNPINESGTSMPQPVMHAIPEGLPLASAEFWQAAQQPTHPRIHALPQNGTFQEMQLFKASYGADFYSNVQN